MEFLKDIVVDSTPTETNFATSTVPSTPSSNTTAPQHQIINSDDEDENSENEDSITKK